MRCAFFCQPLRGMGLPRQPDWLVDASSYGNANVRQQVTHSYTEQDCCGCNLFSIFPIAFLDSNLWATPRKTKRKNLNWQRRNKCWGPIHTRRDARGKANGAKTPLKAMEVSTLHTRSNAWCNKHQNGTWLYLRHTSLVVSSVDGRPTLAHWGGICPTTGATALLWLLGFQPRGRKSTQFQLANFIAFRMRFRYLCAAEVVILSWFPFFAVVCSKIAIMRYRDLSLWSWCWRKAMNIYRLSQTHVVPCSNRECHVFLWSSNLNVGVRREFAKPTPWQICWCFCCFHQPYLAKKTCKTFLKLSCSISFTSGGKTNFLSLSQEEGWGLACITKTFSVATWTEQNMRGWWRICFSVADSGHVHATVNSTQRTSVFWSGCPVEFWPEGGLSPKFPQNGAFSLKLAANCRILNNKSWGRMGAGPPGPPRYASGQFNQRSDWIWRNISGPWTELYGCLLVHEWCLFDKVNGKVMKGACLQKKLCCFFVWVISLVKVKETLHNFTRVIIVLRLRWHPDHRGRPAVRGSQSSGYASRSRVASVVRRMTTVITLRDVTLVTLTPAEYIHSITAGPKYD